MNITMEPDLWEQLIAYVWQARPEEACGFIIGDAAISEHRLHAKRFIPIPNIADHPDQEFVMEAAALTQALFTVEPEQLIGIVHSHPTAPPVPSEADLRTGWHTLPSYWIISLHGPEPELAIYRLYAPNKTELCTVLPLLRTNENSIKRKISSKI